MNALPLSKKNIFQTLQVHKYLFLFQLSPVYLLHESSIHYELVSPAAVIRLFLIYTACAMVFLFMVNIFFKNLYQAGLFVFFLLFLNFSYGRIQEQLLLWFPGTVIARNRFLYPLMAVLILLFFILIKKKKKLTGKTGRWLTVAGFVLLLWGVAELWMQSQKSPRKDILANQPLLQHYSGPKPDIYLILADEYAGDDQLKDIFHFDNSRFFAELENRKFRVNRHSRSNYNITVFSIASILNMDFLNLSKGYSRNILPVLDSLRKNRLSDFFSQIGYLYHNTSFFNDSISKKFPHTLSAFLPNQIFLLNRLTLANDLATTLRPLAQKTGLIKKVPENFEPSVGYNQYIFDQSVALSKENTGRPKLVYSHFFMPHAPYYFDSSGQLLPPGQTGWEHNYNKEKYLSYLRYTNHELLRLVDSIQMGSNGNAIIVLLSDHGFRQFREPVKREYFFSNISAVYLPGQNYALLYDGISNVNVFRSILNTQFNQSLPMLPDSMAALRWGIIRVMNQ